MATSVSRTAALLVSGVTIGVTVGSVLWSVLPLWLAAPVVLAVCIIVICSE